MTQLSRAQWITSYEDPTTGAFPTNTSQAIGADDLQQCMEDLSDSFVNFADDTSTNPSAANQVSSSIYFPGLSVGAFVDYTTIGSAAVLTANASPVTIVSAPGSGYAILPIAFYVFLDYNSAAYATNTTFRFEINSRAVTASNTGLLPATADRYGIMYPIDLDAGDIGNSALTFEVQTGDPTAGNSPIYVTTVYRIVPLGEIA